MNHQYQCWRCGYHYGPDKLVIEPGHLYPVCEDVARCNRHIATRAKDRAAVRVVRRR